MYKYLYTYKIIYTPTSEAIIFIVNYHSSTLDTYVYLARSRASKVLCYIHIILIFIHVYMYSALYAIALRNVMGGATMVMKPGQQNRQAAPAVSEDSVSG